MRIMHISDLHFHDNIKTGERCHSLDCLKGIENLVNEQKPSHIVISGDLTEIGDLPSLDQAHKWIHTKFAADGKDYGLHATEKNLIPIIVPGNHDAFNASSRGRWYERWQSSLSNFNTVFRKYAWRNADCGVKYMWFDDGVMPLFVCLANSCYLSDSDEDASNLPLPSKISNGNISKNQSKRLLQLFDNGVAGLLEAGDGSRIQGRRYLVALKVLVMHHYLFEPEFCDTHPLLRPLVKPFLRMKSRKIVFHNLAMSDFDVILCGHRHVKDIKASAYAAHFDRRGQSRLAFNYARRTLGLTSLPLAADENGILIGKGKRLLLAFLAVTGLARLPADEKVAVAVISFLQNAIQDPTLLRNEWLRHLKTERGAFPSISHREILELYCAVRLHLHRGNIMLLDEASQCLRSLIPKILARPFAQIMPGSSSKESAKGPRMRGVNLYEVLPMEDGVGHRFRVTQCNWQHQSHTYQKGLQQDLLFPAARSLNI